MIWLVLQFIVLRDLIFQFFFIASGVIFSPLNDRFSTCRGFFHPCLLVAGPVPLKSEVAEPLTVKRKEELLQLVPKDVSTVTFVNISQNSALMSKTTFVPILEKNHFCVMFVSWVSLKEVIWRGTSNCTVVLTLLVFQRVVITFMKFRFPIILTVRSVQRFYAFLPQISLLIIQHCNH